MSVKINFNQRLVSIACGLLLLTAAILKLYGVFLGYWSAEQLDLNAAFTIIVSIFEITLSSWLLSGFKPSAAIQIAICCFGLFTFISLYHVLAGAKSCGCFGAALI